MRINKNIIFNLKWYKNRRTKYKKISYKHNILRMMQILKYISFTKKNKINISFSDVVITYSINKTILEKNHYMSIVQKKLIQCSSSGFTQIVIPLFNDCNIKYPNNVHTIGGFGCPSKLRGLVKNYIQYVLLHPKVGLLNLLNTNILDHIVCLNVANTIISTIKRLQPHNKVYLPLEGNLWEYYFHKNVKKEHVNLYPYLNTFIYFDSYSLQTILKAKKYTAILDCGEQLKNHDNLMYFKIGTDKFLSVEKKVDCKYILLLPEGVRYESEKFIELAESLINNNLNYVKIRFHPILKSRRWGKKLIKRASKLNILSNCIDLQNDICRSHTIIYSSSTAAIEGSTVKNIQFLYFNLYPGCRVENDVLFYMKNSSISGVFEFLKLHKSNIKNRGNKSGYVYSKPQMKIIP